MLLTHLRCLDRYTYKGGVPSLYYFSVALAKYVRVLISVYNVLE